MSRKFQINYENDGLIWLEQTIEKSDDESDVTICQNSQDLLHNIIWKIQLKSNNMKDEDKEKYYMKNCETQLGQQHRKIMATV